MLKRLKTYSKLLLLVLFILISITVLIITSKIDSKTIEDKSKKITNTKVEKHIEINKNIDYSKFKENICDIDKFNQREVLLKYQNDKVNLLIGNNKKELENDYYDINIEVKDKIDIYINKLWKEKPNSNFCEKNYIYELVELLNDTFILKLDLAYKEKLVKSIEKNYIEIKKGLLEDKKKNLINLQLDDINFKYTEDEGRLKLEIEFLKL